MIRFTLNINEGQLQSAVHQAVKGVFDQMEKSMDLRSSQAAGRVRQNVSGVHTDVPVLRGRSFEALGSIDYEVTRKSDFFILAEVGVMKGSLEVENYMRVQEEGDTIYPPPGTDTLVFPPGENWHPDTRDSTGEQTAFAGAMMDEIRATGSSLGFRWLKFFDNSVYGVNEATNDLEFLFIRAESVTIDPRLPVGREAPVMVEEIRLDFMELGS